MISNPFFRDNEEKLTYLDVLRCVCIDSEVGGNVCVCVCLEAIGTMFVVKASNVGSNDG